MVRELGETPSARAIARQLVWRELVTIVLSKVNLLSDLNTPNYKVILISPTACAGFHKSELSLLICTSSYCALGINSNH